MSQVTIYHNPRCSKSRETLALLESNGIKPKIICYLEDPPDAGTLDKLLTLLGMSARDLLRTGENEYKELDLGRSDLTEEDLVNAMVKTPKLIQRPIVIANGQARIGRPPASVLEILKE